MMSEHKCLSMLMEWGRDSHSALMVTGAISSLQNAEVRGAFPLETEEPKTLMANDGQSISLWSGITGQKTGHRQRRHFMLRESLTLVLVLAPYPLDPPSKAVAALHGDGLEEGSWLQKSPGPVFFPSQRQPKEAFGAAFRIASTQTTHCPAPPTLLPGRPAPASHHELSHITRLANRIRCHGAKE